MAIFSAFMNCYRASLASQILREAKPQNETAIKQLGTPKPQTLMAANIYGFTAH